nr:hypothetical protein 11 [Moraxellaceae bacterium]
MGGSSSSSSSSSNKTNTENYDQRVTVGGDGLAVGSQAQVEVTDFGAVEGAANVLQDTMGGTADVLKKGLGAMGDVVGKVSDTFQKALKDNNDILAEKVQNDSKEIGSLAMKALVVIAAAVVALGILFGGKR